MVRPLLSTLVLALFCACNNEPTKEDNYLQTPYELGNGNETATYSQAIDFYMALAREYAAVNIQTIGTTDSGLPLHLVTYNPEGSFNFQKLAGDRTIILINNGIHPGESDGVDATMLLFRDLAAGRLPAPAHSVLATIPVYNIGGALERNSTSRANQNGPEAYGFRGNAKNYDLNRDFIKSDSRNTRTFAKIFHTVKPDVFVDNHVSNGADYQYTLTHVFTQHNKLGGALGEYLHGRFIPEVVHTLGDKGWDSTPYVNVFNRPPDGGFKQFMDHSRYSTGYTSLWNTLGVMIETHMLKPYPDRVKGNYDMMRSILEVAEADGEKIKALRKQADSISLNQTYFPLGWKVDSTRVTSLEFKGYQADTLISTVTGRPRLKYDREKPFVKEVPYYDNYVPTDSVIVPDAYIIKKGWDAIKDYLTDNQIKFGMFQHDTTLTVETYQIAGYKTMEQPYEGHYPHYGVEVTKSVQMETFGTGDLIVNTRQPGIRYLMEILEPQTVDSFFNWNFFDTVLQRKEGFSPYVFEDLAQRLLDSDPALKADFDNKKSADPGFAKNGYAQLDWIYQRSPYREKAFLRYPVHRVLGK